MTQDRSKLPVWAYVLAAVVVVAAAAGIGALAFSGPQYAWSSAQVRNGRAIIVAGVNAEVPDEGIVAALDAAITETDLYVYANPRIPESLHEPYQRLGTDGTSLGVLQQRARCGSVSIMDPEVAASHFYRDLRRQPGWRTLGTAEIAATIQRGAFPERYNQNVPEAEEFFSQHVQEARAYVRSWRYPGPPGEECGRDFLSDYAGSPHQDCGAVKTVVGQPSMRHLWTAVKPDIRELFQIDFYLGLGATLGAAALEIVNHEAILRARVPAVIAVAAVTASAVIAVAVWACSFDAAFLRKLAAIGANPVRYLAPLLQTTVLGTAGMLLLIAAAAVPAPACPAVRAIVAGCTGGVAVWAVTSVLPALSTLVQFLGLRYDAASVDDDIRRVGLGD